MSDALKKAMAMQFDEETIDKMIDGTWTPPIKKLAEQPTFDELMAHHEEEATLLLAIITRLAATLRGAMMCIPKGRES
jgi:hypothetical protein